jgi:2-amino-4-hydroxy-6-hydroxymethyldihydropteridine diphosphokinase
MSDSPPAHVYIGLGGNLGQPRLQLMQALDALAQLPSSQLTARSSLYRSRPLGPLGQPAYINAVAALRTRLSPEALLDAMQAIETRFGRVRNGERWGPRTLDLDLLLYDEVRLATPRLQVPHPQMTKRAFVLCPLAEIAPADLAIPGYGRLGDLLPLVSEADVERLE